MPFLFFFLTETPDSIKVANEITSFIYTLLVLLVLVGGGIVGIVRLFLEVRTHKKHIGGLKKEMGDIKKWGDGEHDTLSNEIKSGLETLGEEVDEMCRKIESQIAMTNQRISDQLVDCHKHREQTIKTAEIMRQMRQEMVGQVKRIHERIDLVMENQYDFMMALSTGQFKDALATMNGRKAEWERRDRKIQNDTLEKSIEEDGNGI